MDMKLRWQANAPAALRRGHDEIRAEFVRATMEPGPIREAAMRVAELCLPHFEAEEQTVFPVFGFLKYLATSEARPELPEILALVSAFSARREAMELEHHLIVSAVAQLLQAAHREKNWEYAEFAYNLKVHEEIEDEVIFPTLSLIGKYVR